MKKTINIIYWLTIGSMLLWFTYSKGWLLANFESIDARQAIQMLEDDANITLLDVRTIAEYKEGHLEDAKLIPLQTLSKNIHMLIQDKDKKIVVYCRSGSRSVSASRILESSGFTPVNIKGGILELKKNGVLLVK